MTTKQFAALLGFAFVVTTGVTNFGFAVLCLLGAAIFYAAAAFYEGDLDLGEVQSRIAARGGGTRSSAGAPPRPAAGTRVR